MNVDSVTSGTTSNTSATIDVSGSLEGSNVDLAQGLTNMAVARRAFRADAKAIDTGDRIPQDIVAMVR